MNKMFRKTVMSAAALIPAALFASDASEAGSLFSPEGDLVTIIAGDEVPDPIELFPMGVDAANFTFVITDTDSNVLVYTDSNVIDLEGAGVGTCRVYGFGWSGEFAFPTGVNVHDLTASESYDVSSNRISIERLGLGTVDGGYVLNDQEGYNAVQLYLGDEPNPFRVYAASNASSDTEYAFIITDEDGTILVFPEGNVIDLSAAPPGTCFVYGISFTGELNTTTGINVHDVSVEGGVYELSQNSIRADRMEGSERQVRGRGLGRGNGRGRGRGNSAGGENERDG